MCRTENIDMVVKSIKIPAVNFYVNIKGMKSIPRIIN